MCKKVLIATLAVVVGLGVVSSTRIGRHMRLKWQQARGWVEKQETPEEKIALLKMRLKEMEKQDDQYVDSVAQLKQVVKEAKAELDRTESEFNKRKARIKAINPQLADKAREVVLYEGKEFTREVAQKEFDRAADEGLRLSKVLANQKKALDSKEARLALEIDKREKMKADVSEMASELQALETTLAEERDAQVGTEAGVDDSAHKKARAELTELRKSIDMLKTKREVRGMSTGGKLEDAEKQKARTSEREAFLKSLEGRSEGKESVSQK